MLRCANLPGGGAVSADSAESAGGYDSPSPSGSGGAADNLNLLGEVASKCVSPSSMDGPPDREREASRGLIAAMLEQEQERHYARRDYLRCNAATPKSNGATRKAGDTAVDARCRSKVCQWIFSTVECARLRRETAVAAVDYLDRFLSSESPRAERALSSRREYQLAATTCLYIAISLNEPDGKEIDAAAISGLSRGRRSAEDVVSCQRDIMLALRWRMQAPTAEQFAAAILELLPRSRGMDAGPKLYEGARRQAELAIGDYAHVVVRRSSIAIASTLNSLDGLPPEAFPMDERIIFVQRISEAFGVDVGCALIEAIRGRLRGRSGRAGA